MNLNLPTELSEGRTSTEIGSEGKNLVLIEEGGSIAMDDVEAAVNSLCSDSEFSFDKIGNSCNAPSEGRADSMSRHSSLLSLSQDPQMESASPSPFGEDFDESDIESS